MRSVIASAMLLPDKSEALMSAEVIELTGVETARRCLQAARDAEGAEAVAWLRLAARYMRKTKRTRTPARESRASAQLRQTAKASRG